MNCEMVEGQGVIVIAELPRNQKTTAENGKAHHDEDRKEVHECYLVVMSEKCNQECRDCEDAVGFQRHFNQVLERLSEGISEVEVKLEVIEPSLTVGINTINGTVPQPKLFEQTGKAW